MAAGTPLIAVYGLWHLGSVTAACLAGAGFHVRGLDEDEGVVADLARGRAPLHEPGLDDLLAEGLAAGRLSFTTDPRAALAGAELVWVTVDTPVDEETDRADAEAVVARVAGLLPDLEPGALVLLSSQLPAGTAAHLEARVRERRPGAGIELACSPENLRLGAALRAFREPARIVAGVRSERARALLEGVLGRFGPVEWMAVESAEIAKHAVNAFLATSVVFMNEVAAICEAVGGGRTPARWSGP